VKLADYNGEYRKNVRPQAVFLGAARDTEHRSLILKILTIPLRSLVVIEETKFQDDHFQPLDSNNRIKNFKYFIGCRLGARGPLFLSLSCTEFVPTRFFT
jgi:hypothetical protein